MQKTERRINSMLQSTEAEVRLRGWFLLYKKMRNHLLNSFLARVKNLQVSEDLLQQLFLNMHKKLGEATLPQEIAPEAYVFSAARNLTMSFFRKERVEERYTDYLLQHQPINDVRELVEDKLIRRWERDEARKLLLQLPNERDRLLGLLRYIAELRPSQVYSLTGWAPQELNRRLRRIKKELYDMNANGGAHLPRANPWIQKVAFTNDKSPVSIAYLNIRPHNIYPESQNNLLKDLDVKSIDHLFDTYIIMLRLEGVDIQETTLHYTFMKRKHFNKDVFFEQGVINYTDYNANFQHVPEKGGWKEYLTLTGKNEYPGRIIGQSYNESGDWVGVEFVYPTLNIKTKKAINEKYFHYLMVPGSKEKTIFVYRTYPIKHAPFPEPASQMMTADTKAQAQPLSLQQSSTF